MTHRADDKVALLRLAEAIRSACVEAARQGFEEAAMVGLCGEGAMENALSAIHKLDIQALVHEAGSAEEAESRQEVNDTAAGRAAGHSGGGRS